MDKSELGLTEERLASSNQVDSENVDICFELLFEFMFNLGLRNLAFVRVEFSHLGIQSVLQGLGFLLVLLTRAYIKSVVVDLLSFILKHGVDKVSFVNSLDIFSNFLENDSFLEFFSDNSVSLVVNFNYFCFKELLVQMNTHFFSPLFRVLVPVGKEIEQKAEQLIRIFRLVFCD